MFSSILLVNEVIVKYVSGSNQFNWVRFQVRIEDFIACYAWRLGSENLAKIIDSFWSSGNFG